MNHKESIIWSDLNPICLLRHLLHELPTILAAGLAAAMLISAAVQLFYRPEYTSSAAVAVTLKSGGYTSVVSDLTASAEIAETFTQLFQSNMFSGVAESQLGVASLPGKLTASAIPETNLLRLRVTADSPDDAFLTLKLLLENYDVVSEHVFQNVVLKQLTRPTLSSAPSNPLHTFSVAKKSFAIGCGVMAALILFISLMTDTVQTGSALQRKLDAKLLSTIHHEEKNKTWKTRLKKVNKGLLVTMPIASFRFTEEFRRLASLIESSAFTGSPRQKKVILITSAEENEGKSTVAANLALVLAQGGKKVLLIDADMHKAALYKLFQAKPAHELSDMIRGKEPYQPEYLENQGIWVLFSRQQSGDAAELIASAGMKQLLEKAREEMDYIIIDTPPTALFSDVEVLADQADLSLLVVRQDTTPAGRLNDTIDILNQCSAEFLGCIFNDVRTSSLSAEHYGYGYGRYGHGYGYGYGRGYGHYGYGYGHSYGYGAYGKYHKEKKQVEDADGRA